MTVRNTSRRHGRPPRGGKSQSDGNLSLVTQNEIAELWQEGLPLAEIAKVVNRSRVVVISVLALKGIDSSMDRHRRTGKFSGNWKGGRLVRHGYILVGVHKNDKMAVMAQENGYVFEHRLVMAKRLGRPLHPWETVHHIDGDKSNNSEDNLQLRTGNHGSHVKITCAECGSENLKYCEV